MSKKQIISMFLKEGFLLSPELLEKVNEDNHEEILRQLKGEEKKEPMARKSEEKSKGASVKDFIEYYRKKYEFLSGVLLKKMDAVSINKGRKIFSKTSIIGRVKEKTTRGFVIEDVTGETEVVMNSRGILSGDVIGLKGWFKEGGFFPDEIVWPDIPLTNRGEVPNILLARKLTDKAKEVGIVVGLDPKEKFTTPRWVDVSGEGRNASILVFEPDKKIGEQDAVGFLKRRELPHEEDAGIYTAYLIEKIPNIVWLVENKENWSKNYKGVIVVSTEHESFFEYTEKDGGRFGKI